MEYETFQMLKKQMAKVPPPSSSPPEDLGHIEEFLDEIEEKAQDTTPLGMSNGT
jgi:hypothetical protein